MLAKKLDPEMDMTLCNQPPEIARMPYFIAPYSISSNLYTHTAVLEPRDIMQSPNYHTEYIGSISRELEQRTKVRNYV